MHLDGTKSFLLIIALIAALAGCAGARVETAVPVSSGGSLVTIVASNYRFTPNEIRVEKPGSLALEIKNVSGSVHNFTLKDPQGKVLKNVDIRPRISVISNLELPGPGTYEFFCNKTFHATLGMKGRIVVGR